MFAINCSLHLLPLVTNAVAFSGQLNPLRNDALPREWALAAGSTSSLLGLLLHWCKYLKGKGYLQMLNFKVMNCSIAAAESLTK